MKTETAYLLASIVHLHKCASMYVDIDLWFDTYSEQMPGTHAYVLCQLYIFVYS